MRNALIAALAAAVIGLQYAPPTSGMHGVSVNAGTVRVDQWQCFTPPTSANPIAAYKPCPTRVEFSEELPNNLLVCRSHKTGQTCKTLNELFPVK